MKFFFVFGILTLLAGCATSPSWKRTYAAPYNTASSEEEARIWKKSDEVFADRTDFKTQAKRRKAEPAYPKLLSQINPVLPPALKGEQGVVLVCYLIERDGLVRDARVLESSNPKLDAPAIEAMRKWRFTPGTIDGEPHIWRYTQRFDFN